MQVLKYSLPKPIALREYTSTPPWKQTYCSDYEQEPKDCVPIIYMNDPVSDGLYHLPMIETDSAGTTYGDLLNEPSLICSIIQDHFEANEDYQGVDFPKDIQVTASPMVLGSSGVGNPFYTATVTCNPSEVLVQNPTTLNAQLPSSGTGLTLVMIASVGASIFNR